MTTPNGLRNQFERHVKTYQGLIFTVAFGILGNAEDSLDILQETFLRASSETRFLDEGFDRKNWLLKVARNLALNHRGSWWNRIRVLVGFDLPEQPADTLDPLVLVEHRELIERLQGSLQALSGDERELLTLRYVAGQSYSEIAQTMEIKLGTVMSRLARVKEKLGMILDQEEPRG